MSDPQTRQVTIAERTYSRIERLQVFRPDEALRTALSARLGVNLPDIPNRIVCGNGEALWLGPDEWLLIDQSASAASVLGEGEPARLLSDVTDGLFGLLIGGSDARDLLAQACPLDLHPRVFGEGQSAISIFVSVPVVVIARHGGFELLFDASLRKYVSDWLIEAMASG